MPAEGLRPEVADAIDSHIERHFGPVAYVMHEVMSHLVAVHIYVIAPTEERPFLTLMTTGMSERPMTVPQGHGISPYAELVMCLPADWPLADTPARTVFPEGVDEAAYWPVSVLKQVARLAHEYGTWIGEWHSVPNGDPAEPYVPGTPFVGVAVAPMIHARPEARVIEVDDRMSIDVLALIPLHPAEVALKLSKGTDALIEALDRGRVTELLEPNRPSVV